MAHKSSHKRYQVQAEITLGKKKNPAIKITNEKHPESRRQTANRENTFMQTEVKTPRRLQKATKEIKGRSRLPLNLVFSF